MYMLNIKSAFKNRTEQVHEEFIFLNRCRDIVKDQIDQPHIDTNSTDVNIEFNSELNPILNPILNLEFNLDQNNNYVFESNSSGKSNISRLKYNKKHIIHKSKRLKISH